MVRRAKTVNILADHTKTCSPALMTICEVAQVTNLVTDGDPPDKFGKLLEKFGTRLVAASEEKT